MARFEKLNNICDRAMARMDELGDDAIQAMRNTPEAKARQAENAKLAAAAAKRAAARQASAKAAAVAVANSFKIGQSVRTRRGEIAAVVAIDGSAVELDNGKRFAATMLTAA